VTTPDRWARAERLYHEALACGVHERASFLADACAGDDALRREVESLLAHDGGAAFLSTPAVANDIGGGLRIGQALGPYRISAQIGEGGMGEVYRARDSKLGRDVAIKILPRAFTVDPDRLTRFEREARMLASFNHPHIGAIYGVEESDGVRALVLELVEGETLADKLDGEEARGRGLPIPEALAIARQIADALDAAHERGIVHRDLKPANIKITPAGTVKVLDFGLAKVVAGDASSPEQSRTPPMNVDGTRDGMILGTAAYMSPEQARGHAVDKRTDIWAFGCVLYEVLTGRPAFAGATMSDTVAAVLTHEPDWAALPPTTPPFLSRLLERCLEKDPTRRQRDIGDARLELAQGDEISQVDREQREPPLRWRGRTAAAAGVGGVALVAAAFVLGVFLRREPSPPAPVTPVRFSVFPPQGSRFLHTVVTTFPALSPDGSQLAFVAFATPNRPQIWLRPISGLEARVVPGTEGALSVFWSPDGRSLAFLADRKLKRIDLPGGAAVPLCDVPAFVSAGAWGSGGTILFASSMGGPIFSVSSAGGLAEAIVTPDPSRGERVEWPSFLPDGKRFLYLSQRPDSTGQLMLGARGRASKAIVSAVSNVQWVDPDYLVFAQEGVLVAQRFDQASERIVGAPVYIAEPVDRFLTSGRAMFTTSRSGTIAYHSYANVARLVWVDRTGREVGTVGAPGDYLNVRLSPDGGTVLFERTKPGIGTWDLWTIDLARGFETRLTSDPSSEAFPVWMPDGRAILFADESHSTTLNLARKRLDTGVEDQLLPMGTQQRRPSDVSPDGHTLLFTERTTRGTVNVFTLPLSGPAVPSALFGSRFSESDPRFSPDGRAMAFVSDESGRLEVYVAPFPSTGGKTLVSTGITFGDLTGGARWSHDGRELFYVSTDRRLMAVPIRTTPMLEVGTPVPLFTLQGRAWSDFAVTADGKRFLAVVPQAFAGEQPLTVILNWTAEIRR
jgi:serine/threonine protein kinase/Tol biopolymer transport system component